MNTKGTAAFHNPNQAPVKGNDVSYDRSHVTSGPQTAVNYNKPAPHSKKGRA